MYATGARLFGCDMISAKTGDKYAKPVLLNISEKREGEGEGEGEGRFHRLPYQNSEMNIAATLTANATNAQKSAIKANPSDPLAPMNRAVVMQSRVNARAKTTFIILRFFL